MAGCCDHDHNKKPEHGAVMQHPMIMPTTMIMTTVTHDHAHSHASLKYRVSPCRFT
jgi:hypothetical protein